jgi:hypothetical protein
MITNMALAAMGKSAFNPVYKLGKAKIAIAKTMSAITSKVALSRRVEPFLNILCVITRQT